MNIHTQQTADTASELLRQFAQTDDEAVSAILTPKNLDDFENQSTIRNRKYPACTTLSIFMKQVANENKSCRSALIGHASDQVALGKEVNETTTGPYCRARQRLPESAVKSLLQTSGKNLDDSTSTDYQWNKRRVLLTDGSTLSMPDTLENQKEYPQPKSQKKGLGFPQLRILVLITLGSGAVLNAEVAACKGKGTGELALLRQMHSSLKSGDILLGDAIYENYFTLTQLQQLGVDAVFEKNGARNVDFRTCTEKLGKKDGLFTLARPPRPKWMSEEIYSQQPEELTVRMIKHKTRVIVTTLLDPEAYSAKELIALYISRWHVELDLRSIKTMMKMDILRCGSPDMVRKEIYVHLLVYNMIRALMIRAAKKKG
ncbi:MAG: IS4 family transposase [Candidatus Thioglobus sp.]|nr:MAG: IS4 family transposase [Candidatus Thioglobus sp.]